MVSDREEKKKISEAYSYFDFELQIEIFMDSLFFFPLAVRQIHILIYHSALLEVRTTLFDSWFVAKLLTLLSNMIIIPMHFLSSNRPRSRYTNPIPNRKKSFEQVIAGDCYMNTGYELRFKKETKEKLLCDKNLKREGSCEI